MKPPSPRDPREAVALFRAEIVGALTHRPLSRGALRAELEALAAVPRRPPGASVTRRFGVSTLERWYYAYKAEGLAGLLPKARSDRGHARALKAEQRQTILDIRHEYPLASAELILENLKDSGHLEADGVSPRALRRLFRAEGMDRPARAAALDPHARRRWQASHPGAIWQVDVCHGQSLRGPSGLIPVRVHGMIDDASRYVVGLEAMATVFAEAFTVRLTRRVRRDSTLELDGQTFEVTQGFLAGKRVEVAQRQIDVGDGREAWVEHEGRRFELKPVNPQANATRPREERPKREKRTDFDPATTRLDRAMGRRPRKPAEQSSNTHPRASRSASSPGGGRK